MTYNQCHSDYYSMTATYMLNVTFTKTSWALVKIISHSADDDAAITSAMVTKCSDVDS